MVKKNNKVAVFDFDGTLTCRDTMFDFIAFACGKCKMWIGVLLFSPLIAIMFMKIIDNNRCKQMLLSWYFKGMKYDDFRRFGEEYAVKAKRLLRADTLHLLSQRKKEGCRIYVVSASIREWVAPLCFSLGVDEVLSTEFEVNKSGVITGRFLTHNCFGKEKVRRLLLDEPERDSYYLYAYGDSRGDKEMFEFADEYKKL